MAFDKVKTLRAAEKNLELGKIPAAIKEYCKIVENEPDDFTTLNMVGDLYARVGNQEAAIACFRRIAEHYREQDFGLKAIAMYKKIDRLKPDNTETAMSLADLYAQQGLVVEARTHYLFLADAHSKAGATQEGLDVLRKIADLDPQNTGIRTKLGETYLKEGMSTEAADAFLEAGQQFLLRRSFEEAVDAFGRAIVLRGDDEATLKGLLAAHSARGTADEAAEIIEHASAKNPEDTELLSLLATAYIEAEDPEKAEQATAALVAKEPSAYLRYMDVARLFLKFGYVDEAVSVVGSIAEQMLAEREDNQLLDLINELLACDSDNVQALRLLVRTHWWQRDTEKLRTSLETLAEVAQAAGLEKDERYALTQLTRLAPDQTDHLERLKELGGADEEVSHEDFGEFQARPEPIEPRAEPVAELTAEALSEPDSSTEFEFEWNSLADLEQSEKQPAQQPVAEPEFSFESVVAEEFSSNGQNEEFTFSPAIESDGHADGTDESRNAALRAQELESVDFYIAQGYVDIALDTLDLLEKQFGKHVDIDLRRQQLQGTPPELVPTAPVAEEPQFILESNEPIAEPEVAQTLSFEPPASVPETEPVKSSPLVTGIDPGLAEIFEEYRVAAEGETEVLGNGDFETHYNLGLAYKEMDLFEEALEEFQIAARLVSPDDGTSRYLQCCNLLGHCFMQKGVPQLALQWFNKGLTISNASDDERQALRYEIGAAYEQAGDLNRAIEVFTEIYGVNVSYRGVNERLRQLQARVSGA